MNELTPRKQNIQSTPRKTPVQTRPYLSHGMIHNDPQAYHFSQTPHMIDEIYQEPQQIEQRGIYGTNIYTSTVINSLTLFIQEFQVQTDQQLMEKIYKNKLYDLDLDLIKNNLFEVDGSHIKQFDSELYHQFLFFPAQMITLFDQVIKMLYEKYYIDTQEDQSRKQIKQSKRDTIMIGIQKLSDAMLMRGLQSKHINRLVCFRGIAIRCSDIYPQMKKAIFKCTNKYCQTQIQVSLENAKVQQPQKCSRCKISQSFEIIHNYCHFTDKQYIKIQQLPQYVKQGQTPASINILCYDSNVNSMRPGDRIQIVGIYRCQARKIAKGKSSIETIYSTYIDLISYRILEENKFKASLADCKTLFNDQEKEEFYKIANDPKVIDNLVESFAHSIFGHEQIKKGLLTQIFGGTHKQFEGRGRFRSDINICLVGDPSTAKSQLLKQVHQIAPRGIYTSGKGSSAVGLTANVRKDPQTHEFVLESGALVLSDLGICCIDQFDKMDQNSKLILLEAMEQQTISIAKAGIVCQLNSRTSILSAANPISSKYDPNRSVIENIALPSALLSRFDLIYIILDIPNRKFDERLAKHILQMFTGKPMEKQRAPKISRDILSKYITYARQYISPKLSDQAAKKLVQCYMEMRRVGSSRRTISATPRQLESLIRISQSIAKMKLCDRVQTSDVNMAYELIKDALKQSATDPTTGLIDMDVIVTGQTAASRHRVEVIMNILKKLFKANASEYIGKRVGFQKALQQIQKQWGSQVQIKPREEDTIQALNRLEKQGILTVFGQDKRHKPSFRYLNPQSEQ